jgi:hypothetical protein
LTPRFRAAAWHPRAAPFAAPYLRRELPTLCRQYGIAEAGTFPSSREAADRYPDDFACYLGGGLTIRDDELGADDDEDVLG